MKWFTGESWQRENYFSYQSSVFPLVYAFYHFFSIVLLTMDLEKVSETLSGFQRTGSAAKLHTYIMYFVFKL